MDAMDLNVEKQPKKLRMQELRDSGRIALAEDDIAKRNTDANTPIPVNVPSLIYSSTSRSTIDFRALHPPISFCLLGDLTGCCLLQSWGGPLNDLL